MFRPIKIIDLELSQPLSDAVNLDDYDYIWALVRYMTVPLGFIKMPIVEGRIPTQSIIKKVIRKYHKKIHSVAIQKNFKLFTSEKIINISEVLGQVEKTENFLIPITVIVCTRDRPADLEICLNSLMQIEYPNLEILVVDNAPTDNSTKELVSKFLKVKYVLEPRPGLDWARNKAATEARGEIIAYTDDDTIVDKNWIKALAELFENDEQIMAVTGLVLPYEIESEPQLLFEKYGGFSRGFDRKWYKKKRNNKKAAKDFIGSGKFGTGANMAFRKEIFKKVGFFDPALDVGTVTNGGGDLEMFFRVLMEGYCLVYEPRAIVWHRHRRDRDKLEVQLENNGIGFYSHLVRCFLAYPTERISIAYFGVWWFFYWSIRRLIISIVSPSLFPRDLIIKELFGSIKGLFRYKKSFKKAQTIDSELYSYYLRKEEVKNNFNKVSEIHTSDFDLTRGIFPLQTEKFRKNIILVKRNNEILGQVVIENNYQRISQIRLIESIADKINIKLFYNDAEYHYLKKISQKKVNDFFVNKYNSLLNRTLSVSIVIATYDRPKQLRECLITLMKIKSENNIKIIVVDNHPSSEKTSKVILEFPNVSFIKEERQGLSYARNKGFLECESDIAICLDDDVEISEDWLENILKPFEDENVMAVTGNIYPFELKTRAQNLFEIYGGLGKGFKKKFYDIDWFTFSRFSAAPTWKIGATANAAFRTAIFKLTNIGLLDESLGAGTPTGCSEDTYMFYKILKAEFSIVYEPKAYVWHKHRQEIKTFKKQLYNYSKGHVAYNLLTFINDNDYRGLFRIFVELPLAHLYRFIKRIIRKSDYPISFILIEIFGNLLGPFSLIKSKKRVKKLGASREYHFDT
jgi:GT2 family glycosyltransferase